MQLKPEARIGTVDPVARDRLGERHPRPRRRRDVELLSLEHRSHHRFHHVDHVVLVDERHLDVELGELGLAVGARVLVAETAGDLVVALEPADHQQLLEQLRRLRQRVERAGLDPRRHQVVARALGSRAGEVGGLDLEEVALVQDLAHRRDHAVTERERALKRRAAEIEGTVAQSDDFVRVSAVVDRERGRLGVGEDLELGHRELDLARREVGVHVLGIAPGHGPAHADHILGPERVGALVRLGRVLGMEDELKDARAVAHVDEDQPAVVAPAVHPAGHPRLGVGAVGGQLAAPDVAVFVRPRRVLHSSRPSRRISGITSAIGASCSSPDSMFLSRADPFSPTIAT